MVFENSDRLEKDRTLRDESLEHVSGSTDSVASGDVMSSDASNGGDEVKSDRVGKRRKASRKSYPCVGDIVSVRVGDSDKLLLRDASGKEVRGRLDMVDYRGMCIIRGYDNSVFSLDSLVKV